MKLVHILDNLDRGGAQTMLRSVVAGLTRRGYKQHIICLNEKFNAQTVASMQHAGATVEIVGRPRLYALIGIWQIVRELRRRRPDLVHTELPWGDLIGRLAARIAGIGSVISTVTCRYAEKPRLQLLVDRITAPWADRVAFQSAEIVEFSIANEGIRPEQVCCIPNGIDLDDTDRTAAAVALRGQYGNGARVVIGMVARLHPTKGQSVVIEAFAKVASISGDVYLWLIGDGPDRARLLAQVERLRLKGRVLFAGDRGDVRDWLAAMDIFVHPTYMEGLPLAVLEAMLAAKPVIATPVDGVRGLITQGVHGWLVPPDDGDGLANAIQTVIDNPELAARVAAAGAERVRREFTADRAVDSYDRLFRSVVERRSHPVGATVQK